MLLQNITLLLKIDDMIGLDWREAFWGIWILLSMLAGQVLVLTLLALSNCDILMRARNYNRRLTLDCKRCLFTSFAWISSATLLIFSVNMVVSIFRYQDHENKSQQELLSSCYCMLGWLAVVYIVVVLFKQGFM